MDSAQLAGRKPKDRTDVRYGHLVAVRVVGVRSGKYIWECRCDCGSLVNKVGTELSKRHGRRCDACFRRAQSPDPLNKFIKSAWTCMNVRCGNGKYRIRSSKNYSYESVMVLITRDEFREWCESRRDTILSLSRPSIDRIDKKRGYEAGNMQVLELAENIRKDKTVFAEGFGRCYVCRQIKPEDDFVRCHRRMNGRTTICRECERKRTRGRQRRSSGV